MSTRSEQGSLGRARKIGADAKIFIVDDHPVVRDGLCALLAVAGFEVVGQAGGESEAKQALPESRPEVALVDLWLSEGSGLDLIAWIHENLPQTRVLVLSMHEERLFAGRAMDAGASGYLEKTASGDSIIDAVRRVASGRMVLSDSVAGRLLHRVADGGKEERTSELDALSDRELEIYGLVGKGLSSREIADQLDLSIKTVDAHRQNIKHKLNLKHSAELAHHASIWCAWPDMEARSAAESGGQPTA